MRLHYLKLVLVGTVILFSLFASSIKANELEELEQPEQDTIEEPEQEYVLEELQQVIIAEPFINIHTGPGTGFPVYYIVERKAPLYIAQRRYDWFKVVTNNHKVGWVPLDELNKALNPDGSKVSFETLKQDDFFERTWEVGFKIGDFESAKLLGLTGSWLFTENLAVEATYGEALGDFSKITQFNVAVINHPFTDWDYSPFFGVGAGKIKVQPNSVIVQEVDRTDETVFVTTGLKAYLSQRFVMRIDYRHYVILTTQETNEDIEEWSIGFSVFF